MQTDTKVKIKSTGQVGYVANVDEHSVCIRVPSVDGWPFPSYQWVARKDVVSVREKKEIPDVGVAPF